MNRDRKLAARRRARRAVLLHPHRRPPWRRWFPIIVIVLIALAAPMLAHAQSLPDSVTLGWTETGDDGVLGTPSLVELRMSTSPITLANWALAALVAGVPTPAAAGTPQTVVVRGLIPGAAYYFALRSSDEAGNWSGLSNQVMWDGSLDTTAPAVPSGLAGSRSGSAAHLTWNANTEGDLAGYCVYRATVESGPFLRANDSLLVVPGLDDTNVPPGVEVVWYRVAALDQSGNASTMSSTAAVSFAKAAVALQPVYPNPSRITAPVRIPVLVTSSSKGARVDVLDSGGRRVRRLDLGALAPGSTEITWDGRNDAGRLVAPGVYSAVLAGDGLAQVVRLVRVP